MVESFEGAESKYGKIYKVAGPLIVAEKCLERRCTRPSRSDGLNSSEKSSSSKAIPLQSSATRTHVSTRPNSLISLCFLAGLTVGDPVLRTHKPLSVELGPGKCWPSFRPSGVSPPGEHIRARANIFQLLIPH